MGQRKNVLVVGGGVIGVCCAYYLSREGCRVTLLEKNEIGSGCSHGNAGWIAPSYAVPMAAPGMIGTGIRWMFSPDSPFYIKPRLDSALLSWLCRFSANCTNTHVRRSVPVLRDLSFESLKLFKELSSIESFDFGFRRDGLLRAFRSLSGFEACVREAVMLKEAGIDASVMDAEAVHKFEPCLGPEVAGGVFFPGDAHLAPEAFLNGLTKALDQSGVKLRRGVEVMGFLSDGPKIRVVETTKGNFDADEVVIAAGAWSPELFKILSVNIPMQSGKGYSVTCMRPKKSPLVPISLAEAKVAVTPMGNLLRFGGTLELSGNDMSLNRVRIAAIMTSASLYLRDVDQLSVIETWRGLRPCTPDGLPVIGRIKRFENVVIATGHGMLGMSLGPITGKLVAQLIAGHPPQVNLQPLRTDRF